MALLRKSRFLRLVPRTWRIKKEIKKVNQEYRPKILEAKRDGNREQAQKLVAFLHFDLRIFHDELDEIYTKRLLRKARHLRLPITSHPTVNEAFDGAESDDWRLSDVSGWILTDVGYAKLNKEVKKEQRESIRTWSAVIGMLTGLFGALAALAAILAM